MPCRARRSAAGNSCQSSVAIRSKLQQSRHAALDAYLDGAESFDYVDCRYDAIASGRLRWEARPRDRTVREINNQLRDPYFDWTLAERGRSVVLQRGIGTGTYRKHAKATAVKIAQVYF